MTIIKITDKNKKNTQLILETIDENNRNGRNYVQMANNSN